MVAAVVASVDDVDVTVEPIAGVAAADALHAVAERRGAALVVVRSTDRGRVGRRCREQPLLAGIEETSSS